MKSLAAGAALMMVLPGPGPASAAASTAGAIVRAEFIFEQAPHPACHASTLAESKSNLVAAWFGGTAESRPDVGIWCARQDRSGWSAPVEVANGIEPNGKRYPCWNPVLFQPRQGPLLLFYKVGPSPSKWWGMLKTSDDGGRSWSPARRLPKDIFGPIKNKPVEFPAGTLLCPSSTEDDGWRIHLERTSDLGATWTRTEALNRAKDFGAIQPTILRHGEGRLQLLCRSRQQRITECWSEDGGVTWSAMRANSLPNPNSGIDGVTLDSGAHLLVYNHTVRGRTPLNVATSKDGRIWSSAVELETEPGEYSYPAVIQTADGLAHVTYTWQRKRIKHVALDPRQF
jgi:predicted neuraminidase